MIEAPPRYRAVIKRQRGIGRQRRRSTLPFWSICGNSVEVAINARTSPNVPINIANVDCKRSTHSVTVNAGTRSSFPKNDTPRITPLTSSIFSANPIDPTTSDDATKKINKILFRMDSWNVMRKIQDFMMPPYNVNYAVVVVFSHLFHQNHIINQQYK